MFGQPANEKIEAAPSRMRTNSPPPARPSGDQLAKAEEPHDLLVRGMLEQASGRPVAIQTTDARFSPEKRLELIGIELVVPEVGWAPANPRSFVAAGLTSLLVDELLHASPDDFEKKAITAGGPSTGSVRAAAPPPLRVASPRACDCICRSAVGTVSATY